MVLGWLCCGLRFGEALAMERHSDGEIEMRDRDKKKKYIYIYIYILVRSEERRVGKEC